MTGGRLSGGPARLKRFREVREAQLTIAWVVLMFAFGIPMKRAGYEPSTWEAIGMGCAIAAVLVPFWRRHLRWERGVIDAIERSGACRDVDSLIEVLPALDPATKRAALSAIGRDLARRAGDIDSGVPVTRSRRLADLLRDKDVVRDDPEVAAAAVRLLQVDPSFRELGALLRVSRMTVSPVLAEALAAAIPVVRDHVVLAHARASLPRACVDDGDSTHLLRPVPGASSASELVRGADAAAARPAAPGAGSPER